MGVPDKAPENEIGASKIRSKNMVQSLPVYSPTNQEGEEAGG